MFSGLATTGDAGIPRTEEGYILEEGMGRKEKVNVVKCHHISDIMEIGQELGFPHYPPPPHTHAHVF